jgi:hypothetical protein
VFSTDSRHSCVQTVLILSSTFFSLFLIEHKLSGSFHFTFLYVDGVISLSNSSFKCWWLYIYMYILIISSSSRNYQLLVICHVRSNVTSLNLSLKKKGHSTTSKSQSCVNIVKLPIKTLLVFKKKVKTQQKNHKAVLKLWNYRQMTNSW